MKRLRILIDDDLDAELERLAVQQGTSKAALIRLFVRDRVNPLPPFAADPLVRMAGTDDFDLAPIDEVVYG